MEAYVVVILGLVLMTAVFMFGKSRDKSSKRMASARRRSTSGSGLDTTQPDMSPIWYMNTLGSHRHHDGADPSPNHDAPSDSTSDDCTSHGSSDSASNYDTGSSFSDAGSDASSFDSSSDSGGCDSGGSGD